MAKCRKNSVKRHKTSAKRRKNSAKRRKTARKQCKNAETNHIITARGISCNSFKASFNSFVNIEKLNYDICVDGEKVIGITNTLSSVQKMASRDNASKHPSRQPKLKVITCSGCDYTFCDMVRKFGEVDLSQMMIELSNHGIIKEGLSNHEIIKKGLEEIKCKECDDSQMKPNKKKPYRYKCFKRKGNGKRCNKRYSLFKNSIFSSIRKRDKFFLFIFMYSNGYLTQEDKAMNLDVKQETIHKWEKKLDSVCIKYLQKYPPLIGGKKKEVEIDETVIAARVDKETKKKIYYWLLGGVERYSPCARFVTPLFQVYMDREFQKEDKDTIIKLPKSSKILNSLIKKNVKSKSIIYTDEWPGYNNVSEIENRSYIHKKVAHRQGFVNPNRPYVNTQKVEGFWRHLKKEIVSPGKRLKYMERYLARFLVLHKNQRSPTKTGNREPILNWKKRKFHDFLHVIADVYSDKDLKQNGEGEFEHSGPRWQSFEIRLRKI